MPLYTLNLCGDGALCEKCRAQVGIRHTLHCKSANALGLGDVADGALVACRGGLEVTIVDEAAGGADVVAVDSSGVHADEWACHKLALASVELKRRS